MGFRDLGLGFRARSVYMYLCIHVCRYVGKFGV